MGRIDDKSMRINTFSFCLLGFASGLPYMLVFATLSTWLAVIDINIATIGFFSWVSLTYSLKFLWAPLIDRFSIPFLNKLGKRKSWIFFSQSLIILFLFLLANTNPINDLGFFAFYAFLVALIGSFQDIAIDALRIELVDIKNQGDLAASYQLGYRIAILLATSGALLLASRIEWSYVYQIMAIAMILGILGCILIKEQINSKLRRLNFVNSIYEPIKDFTSRFGIFLASLLLLIISTYRVTDIVTGQITNVFYIKLGFSLEEIALIVKSIALAGSIFGFFIGGFLIKKFDLNKCLIIGAILVLTTNLFFATLAIMGKNLGLLTVIVGLDSIAAGVVGTINITFLTSLVSKQYTAVQYALLTSFMMLPGKLLAGFSGLLIVYFSEIFGNDYGWMSFYVMTSLLTIPSIVLIYIYGNNKYKNKVIKN